MDNYDIYNNWFATENSDHVYEKFRDLITQSFYYNGQVYTVSV